MDILLLIYRYFTAIWTVCRFSSPAN